MACCSHQIICTDTVREVQVLTTIDNDNGVVSVNRYDLPGVTAFAGNVADLDCSAGGTTQETVDATGTVWDALNASWIDPATRDLGVFVLVENTPAGTQLFYRGAAANGDPQWKQV